MACQGGGLFDCYYQSQTYGQLIIAKPINLIMLMGSFSLYFCFQDNLFHKGVRP